VTFNTTTIQTGFGAYEVGIAYFDNDLLPDICVSNSLTSTVSVLRQNPQVPGTFLPQFEFYAGANPLGMWQADVNQDGKTDIIVSSSNVVSVLLNTRINPGEVNFADRPVFFAVGNGPVEVVGADFNGDGLTDLACTNYFSNTVTVLMNTGSANVLSFAPSTAYATGNNPWGIDAGDFDGDNKTDIVAGNDYDGTVNIFFNSPATQPTVAPFVDNGLSGGAVFGIVIGITAGFCLLMLAIFYLVRYSVKRRVPPVDQPLENRPAPAYTPTAPPAAGTAGTTDFD